MFDAEEIAAWAVAAAHLRGACAAPTPAPRERPAPSTRAAFTVVLATFDRAAVSSFVERWMADDLLDAQGSS